MDRDAPSHVPTARSHERARCVRELEEAARACRTLEGKYRSAGTAWAARYYWPVFAAYGEERARFSCALRAAAVGIADRGGAFRPRAGDDELDSFALGGPSAVLAACEDAEGVAASACLRALVAPLPRDLHQAISSQLDAIVQAKRHLKRLRDSGPDDD